MDGTPIFDIKPYLPFTDSHPEARGGFAAEQTLRQTPLEVVLPPSFSQHFTPRQLATLREVLSQDPRPHYQDDAARIYIMEYADREVRFRVEGGVLQVL